MPQHVVAPQYRPLRPLDRPPEVVVGLVLGDRRGASRFVLLQATRADWQNRAGVSGFAASQSRGTPVSVGDSGTARCDRFPRTRFFSRTVTVPPAKSTSVAAARSISLRRDPVYAANATIG